MKAFMTQKASDGRREKRLISGLSEPQSPAANQVKVQTMFTGLTNGTERNDLIAGNYSTPDEKLPAGMGYQNVGSVIEVGSAVDGVTPGDIVYSGTWLLSDHAERVTVPATDFQRFDAFMKLPAGIDPKHAALFGFSSVGVRICKAADIRLGERVLVVGLGGLGQIVTQVASAMGGSVTACDINVGRLDLAESIGAADRVLNTAGRGWPDQIEDGSFDVVIDVAGVPGMEDALLNAAAVAGRVLFIAGRSRVDYDFNAGQFKEITIRQIAHFDNDDLEKLTRLVQSGKVRIGPLIQEVVPAKDCARIYDALRERPDTLMGIVFSWADGDV